jgi:hypothetical protein
MRPDFPTVRSQFACFLEGQSWPREIRWVSREAVTRSGQQFWVATKRFVTESYYEAFYERLRKTQTSIRIDALGTLYGATVAYVEDYGGDGAHLNFGIPTGRPPLLEDSILHRLRFFLSPEALRRGLDAIPPLENLK